MLYEALRQLKAEKNLSTNQIAARSGIPASTISRILSGQTDSPNIQTIAAIVNAMGGSLDELVGIKEHVPPNAEEMRELRADNKALRAQLDENKAELRRARKWLLSLAILCGALALCFATLLIVDALIGTIGIIRY